MIVLTDTIEVPATVFDASGRLTRTSDGYAVMECPVARSGIQEYLAAELGDAFSDRDPRDVIRVYRPESVIFGDASLSSYAHKPLTNDHPPVAVTAENWSQYAIGWTGDEAIKDGKRVRVPMLMADANAIAAVEAGKVEWSAGYAVTFDRLPNGVAPDGTMADAIVTGQKINHIALVDRGRAGPECRIGDNERRMTSKPIEGDRRMAEVKMTFDGLPFTVADATAEAVVNKIVAARDAAVSALDAATAKHDAHVAKLDAEIEALKSQVVDEAAIDALAAIKADVLADAKSIHDADYSGKTVAQIKRAVVIAKVGDAMADKSDDYIAARFDTLKDAAPVADKIAETVKDGALKVDDAKSAYETARAKRLAEMRGETVK